MPISSSPVFLLLGSNVEPRRCLPAALSLLEQAVDVERVSAVWETVAVDSPGAPDFLNAALRVRTDLAPVRLKFDVLRPVERRLGRVRGSNPNAPRTIDLDIALVGSLVLHDEANGLRVPDPDIRRRAHVALPLADLAPALRHPETGETLAEIARRFAGAPGVRRLSDWGLVRGREPAGDAAG